MSIREFVNLLCVLSVIFIERKKPMEALFWVMVLNVFPLFGVAFYLMFGSTIWIKALYKLRSGRLDAAFHQRMEAYLPEEGAALFTALKPAQAESAIFNYHNSRSHLALKNRAEIITSGKEKYARLFADLRAAKETIHIVYYGLHKDEVGLALVDILAERARVGVQVRVLYDGIGSFFTPRGMFRPLLHAGGSVKRIKSVLTHYRNHRKIVVIDGKIGYTGGMNIGKKYLGALRHKSPWRDTQIRIEGDAVYHLQYFFLYDWLYASARPGISQEAIGQLFPAHAVEAQLICQVVASGVDTEQESMKLAYLRMIASAKRRIVIQSPYFVPNSSLLNALKVAAASGVEVILMLPGKSSSFFLDPTTRHYVAMLLPYGVRVFHYRGYIHAKTMTIDGGVTCIGTVNIDVRSMELDDELCVIFYDEAFHARHNAILEEDFRNCDPLDLEAFETRGIRKRLAEKVYSLLSPLL